MEDNGHSAACGCGFFKSTMDTVLEELNKRIVEMEENGDSDDSIMCLDDIDNEDEEDLLSL